MSASPRPKESVYAFIDSQNLNLGTSRDLTNKQGKVIYKGWKLDNKKFFIYMRNKFRVTKAFLFIGYTAENETLYATLRSFGYTLVFKPTVKDSFGRLKGNVDAELVLYASKICYAEYTKAVIVSGDGDFLCLHDELHKEQKLLKIVIPNAKSESSLLKKLQKYKVYLEFERKKLEYERIVSQ